MFSCKQEAFAPAKTPLEGGYPRQLPGHPGATASSAVRGCIQEGPVGSHAGLPSMPEQPKCSLSTAVYCDETGFRSSSEFIGRYRSNHNKTKQKSGGGREETNAVYICPEANVLTLSFFCQ